MKCRRFYLPSEFPLLISTGAYPPEVDAKSAIWQLLDIITAHENANPGPSSLLRENLTTNLRKGLPKFQHHVSCHTRKEKTPDHCYTTIRGAYRSLKRVPLGISDNNMVYLVSIYRQQLKRDKPVVRTVRQYTRKAIDCLNPPQTRDKNRVGRETMPAT